MKIRRFTLIALAVVVVLAVAGVVYQSWSVKREVTRFAPPGMLVDVGGRRLHIVCIGDGAPAVIFEASGFGNSLSFSARARKFQRILASVLTTGWARDGAIPAPT